MRTVVSAFALTAIMLGVLSGCQNKETDGPVSGTDYSSNFVDMYVCPQSVEMSFYQDNTKILRIAFDGSDITSHSQDKDVADKFEALAEKYGDTQYNRQIVPYSNKALSVHLSSLSITCDREFEGIPAGESLENIVKLYSASAYDYIANGYKGISCEYPVDWESSVYPPEEYVPVVKSPGNFGADGLKMLFPECALYFESVPRDGIEYTFTVNFSFDNGSSIDGTISHIF